MNALFQPRVTPERILQYAWGFSATAALATAIELDVFTHFARGRHTLEELLQATGSSARGLPMLLAALCAFGLLERKEGGFALGSDSTAFLSKDSPGYLGEFALFHAREIDQGFQELARCVRTGRPVRSVDKPAEGVPIWHQLVDALFALNHGAARALGEELARVRGRGPLEVLDVAAGSGVWGIGVAEVLPGARITFQDLAPTLEHTRAQVERHGLGSRASWLPGDLRQTDFGRECFDLAVLGHICHSEGAAHTQALFARCARALRPGGTLAIAEFLADPERSGPPMPLVFALNMLVHTSEGDTFSPPELARRLEAAGFRDPRTLAVSGPSPLVLAPRA